MTQSEFRIQIIMAAFEAIALALNINGSNREYLKILFRWFIITIT